MDEPTAALGVKEAGVVLRYIAQARARGLGVVFITHNVHHAYPDRRPLYAAQSRPQLRTFRKSEVSREEVVAMMAGGEEFEELAHELRRIRAIPIRPPARNALRFHSIRKHRNMPGCRRSALTPSPLSQHWEWVVKPLIEETGWVNGRPLRSDLSSVYTHYPVNNLNDEINSPRPMLAGVGVRAFSRHGPLTSTRDFSTRLEMTKGRVASRQEILACVRMTDWS